MHWYIPAGTEVTLAKSTMYVPSDLDAAHAFLGRCPEAAKILTHTTIVNAFRGLIQGLDERRYVWPRIAQFPVCASSLKRATPSTAK